MRSIERSGVIVDRCTECGGLFLDRGELEKLMDAESTHNSVRVWRHDEDEEEEGRGYGRRRGGGFLGGMFGGGATDVR
jgi:Zn-finger nucleic acid-binding protein